MEFNSNHQVKVQACRSSGVTAFLEDSWQLLFPLLFHDFWSRTYLKFLGFARHFVNFLKIIIDFFFFNKLVSWCENNIFLTPYFLIQSITILNQLLMWIVFRSLLFVFREVPIIATTINLKKKKTRRRCSLCVACR